MSRRRRLAVWLLIVFASLIAFVSTLALWVDRRTWWGIALFAILIAAGVIALQRQLRDELESPSVPAPKGGRIAGAEVAPETGLAVR